MVETGYAKFHDINCIYFNDNNSIRLVPTNANDNIIQFLSEKNFFFEYGDIAYTHIAYIERIKSTYNNSIELISKYALEFVKPNPDIFSCYGLEIIGEALDEFFNPIDYFYSKKVNDEQLKDLLYHIEHAENWIINFEGLKLFIYLSYGNVLKDGIGCDLKIHPKLQIRFESPITDIQCIYKIYLIVIKFFQIARYDLDYGHFRVELIDKDDYLSGRLFDYNSHCENFAKHPFDLSYKNYRPYISKLFQFAANNINLPIDHFPSSSCRFNDTEYTASLFVSIFGAFENEYSLLQKVYGEPNLQAIENIKQLAINKIKELDPIAKTPDEKKFVCNAKSRINDIGTEFGQAKKIQYAYSNLFNAIKSSLDILFLGCNSTDIQNALSGNIHKLARELSDIRGKCAHGNVIIFNDLQKQKIHFLEVLVYCQMLRRAGFDDKDIEKIIGIIFTCNFIYR